MKLYHQLRTVVGNDLPAGLCSEVVRVSAEVSF